MNVNRATQSFPGVMTIVVCENCRQKLRIPQSRTWIRVTCPTCRYEFNYRFVDRFACAVTPPPKIRSQAPSWEFSYLSYSLGVVLFIGNLSGIFPTFPYAGFITIVSVLR